MSDFKEVLGAIAMMTLIYVVMATDIPSKTGQAIERALDSSNEAPCPSTPATGPAAPK